ncbi:MAG: phosphate acetyltransferase [Crocosphaera sp.]|nr:phosphate acetyltransferase [Crocosphaera sp.]
MGEPTKELSASFYPHLEEIKSGEKMLLMIEGTKIPLTYLIEDYYGLNQSVDAVIKKWEHLAPALILSALAYYHDHISEVQKLLQRQEEVANQQIAKNLYPDLAIYEYLQHQGKLFDKMLPQLLLDYENYYVYFEEGKVLEHHADEEKLLDLVEKKYGLKPMFIEKVKKPDHV